MICMHTRMQTHTHKYINSYVYNLRARRRPLEEVADGSRSLQSGSGGHHLSSSGLLRASTCCLPTCLPSVLPALLLLLFSSSASVSELEPWLSSTIMIMILIMIMIIITMMIMTMAHGLPSTKQKRKHHICICICYKCKYTYIYIYIIYTI